MSGQPLLVKQPSEAIEPKADLEDRMLNVEELNELFSRQSPSPKAPIPIEYINRDLMLPVTINPSQPSSGATEGEPTTTVKETKAETKTINKPDHVIKLYTNIVALESTDPHDYDSTLAVATVIMNRVKSDRFPNSIESVIKQSGQFCAYTSTRIPPITNTVERVVIDSLNGSRNLPDYILFFATKEAYNRSSFFQSLEVYDYRYYHVWAYYKE